MDTPETGVQEGVDENQPETYAGTYADREATEKGIAEQNATINRLRSERDKSRNNESKMTAILEKLSDSATAKPAEAQPDPKQQIQDFAKQVAGKFDDDPEGAVISILEAVSGWQGQSEAQQAKQREQALKSLAEEIGTTVKSLKDKLIANDPDMLKYGDSARELAKTAEVDFESNREMFIKIAKANGGTVQPERHDLPGGPIRARVAHGDETPMVSELDRMAGWDQLSKDEKAFLIKKRKEEGDKR